MGKTLRLGFIMGGGVSLGTFSGAALSEAIKQQIVYGQYDTGKVGANGEPVFAPYDKVEIDVFSGASAGAISLAIMLRILVNPKDKFHFLGYRNYEEMREAMEKKITAQFDGKALEMRMQLPEKYEQLIAAQIIQEFQDKVWSKEVDLARLLGTGRFTKDLTENPSFMDRGVVDRLGIELFQFKNKEQRLNNKILLGNRVLFGCTLANLSHTLQKSKRTALHDTFKPSLVQALNDSSVDRIHSELRVFDINFKTISAGESPYYPLNWVQYHVGSDTVFQQEDNLGNSYSKKVKDLNKNEVWREITATAIASAAVPFAFEPVVLNRYNYEYGSEWASELKNRTSYPFTYVDGGVFNNEPIKEALRLASYIDTVNPDKNFERQLIFVDPDVTELENQFRIHAHEKLTIGRSIFSSKTKVSSKPTLLRLASGMTHILSAVLNEAQSIEVSKITQVTEQFELRQVMRSFYHHTIQGIPADKQIIEMRNFAKMELDKTREKLCLPKNTLQLQHEFLRIIHEESKHLKSQVPTEEAIILEKINEFIYSPTPSKVEFATAGVFILSCLTLDIAMDLVGKSAHAKIVPIAPFNFYEEGNDYELMALPGKGMAGFTGFASFETSIYEVAYGKYCARRILQELQLTAESKQNLELPAPFDYNKFDTKLKQEISAAIVKRLKEMLPSGLSTVIPFLEGYMNETIQGFVDNNINGNAKVSSFEFRIRVPNDTFVLRGFTPDGTSNSKKSLSPVLLNNEYYLVTKLNYDFEDDQWKGIHTNFMQNIYIDKTKLFEDAPALSVELPMMSVGSEGYLSPNPIFVLDARAGLNIPKYTELNAQNWELKTDVLPLDTHLWGEEA